MYYITLTRFHIYNKIHNIHRNNLQKSWDRVQGERRKTSHGYETQSYFKILKKYKMNNFS